MKRLWFRNRGLPSRLSVAILLTIYLSIYPAVILCNLHCEFDQINEDEGLSRSHSSHTHSHEHGHNDNHADSARQPEPFQKDKDSNERYSFCSFAQSVSYIGVFTIPFHITGIFEMAAGPHFHAGEALSQTFYLSHPNRAPPLPSPV